jgi:hypothetical protein
MIRSIAVLMLLGGAVLTGADAAAGGKERPTGGGMLTVIDNAGKEHQLKTWTIQAGTRRLSWLTPPNKEGKPTGPEVLELREERSTTFQDGIMTFVPLEHISKIDYDLEKKTVSVTVLTSGDKKPAEMVLTGPTRFVGVNKLTIEADIDLGDLGVSTMKFQGGTPKGIRGLRFGAARPAPPLGDGRKGVITAVDKEKSTHPVVDLQPLYRLGNGSHQLIPTLMFKRTVKIPITEIQALTQAEGEKGEGSDFEVTLKGGKKLTLTLIDDVNPTDGEKARLIGLVGRTAAGYKLFPMHTIAELRFDGKDGER